MGTHIRTWKSGKFRLELFDTHEKGEYGRSMLAYELWYDGKCIFAGEQYSPSPLHSINSDDAVAGILWFLSLKPGDTDAEYFEDYTPKQLEFAELYGEKLGMLAMELEEQSS